jgi:hypothetical protein
LDSMKKELPELLLHARRPFDFSGVSGAAEYDASLARKLQRIQASSPAQSSSSSLEPLPVVDEKATTREGGCCGELGERPHRKSAKDLGVVESPALSLRSLLAHSTSPRCPCAAIQRLRGACLLADQAYFGANGRVGPGRVNRSTSARALLLNSDI